jgi:tryptophan halogenase
MNIVVLGGGSAGWITALYAKKAIPESNVVLIKNEKVGIIGVGEATTPNIIEFLNFVNIDPLDVIRNTEGTIKNGISFENWNGDGKKYFHGFNEHISTFRLNNLQLAGDASFYMKNLSAKGLDFNEYTYMAKLSYEDKVDLQNTSYALHFDANLFSKYLESVGVSRGISVVDGEFNHATNDEKGNISSINLTDGRVFETDFVFDCSGFNRLLIGKHYNEKWISYKKHLPMKKGIPFWIDTDENLNPYTSAIAMKYGWMWKTPLQHRYGCGYIFDSDYINEDQALEEAETLFNRKLKINKVIDFEAGRYENFWVKNCMSVGLSSSFIEPLESTSLFLSISQLFTFSHFINDIKNRESHSVKRFNEIVSKNMDTTLHFIYMHYLTKRDDSDFWKNFKHNYTPPEKFKELLEIIKTGNFKMFDTHDIKITGNFNFTGYLQVCNGLQIYNKPPSTFAQEDIYPSINEYKRAIDYYSSFAQKHREFLNSI